MGRPANYRMSAQSRAQIAESVTRTKAELRTARDREMAELRAELAAIHEEHRELTAAVKSVFGSMGDLLGMLVEQQQETAGNVKALADGISSLADAFSRQAEVTAAGRGRG